MSSSWRIAVNHVVSNSIESFLVPSQGYPNCSITSMPVKSDLISSRMLLASVWPQSSLTMFVSLCLFIFVWIVKTCFDNTSCRSLEEVYLYLGFEAGGKMLFWNLQNWFITMQLTSMWGSDKPGEQHWLVTHIPSWFLSLFWFCRGWILVMWKIHLRIFVGQKTLLVTVGRITWEGKKKP